MFLYFWHSLGITAVTSTYNDDDVMWILSITYDSVMRQIHINGTNKLSDQSHVTLNFDSLSHNFSSYLQRATCTNTSALKPQQFLCFQFVHCNGSGTILHTVSAEVPENEHQQRSSNM